jgi:ADP-ribose pyrophosphatase
MKKIIPKDSVLVPEQAKRVFKGEIFEVYQWPQKMFDGSSATFEMLKRPDTVTCICVVDDKILMIDDEQPHTSARKGFPGGRVDEEDVDIVSAAQREVLEETGYSFKNWRLVKVYQPFGKLEWFVHILIAWDMVSKQAPAQDAGEKISLEPLSFEEVKQMVITKSGHLGESMAVFEDVNNLDELLDLPEYQGQIVDR